jgi:hypothetical protein
MTIPLLRFHSAPPQSFHPKIVADARESRLFFATEFRLRQRPREIAFPMASTMTAPITATKVDRKKPELS